MKDPLKRFTIAITGDFGEHRKHDKMKDWIQINGGTFASEITNKVTHLICSKKHFKQGVAMVRQARKIKSVKIVSFDWLEDSLMKMWPRKEHDYLMEPKVKLAATTKAKKKKIRKDNVLQGLQIFEKGCKDFEKDMFSNGYGIYHDPTIFAYDITLARANLLANRNERYTLKLYESHAIPKLYACYVKYSAPGSMPEAKTLAPIGSSFDVAFGIFKKFFKLKTHKEWDQRFLKTNLAADTFVYAPPRVGEPRGMISEEASNE